MPSDFEATDSFDEALGKLAGLRRFSGPPALFWQSYIDAMVALTGARFGLVARRREGEASGWRKVVASPANLSGEGFKSFFAGMEALCDACMEKGMVKKDIRAAATGSEAEVGVAVRLETGRASERWVAVFLLTGDVAISAGEVIKRVLL